MIERNADCGRNTVKHIFRICTVVFLGVCLESALVAQAIAPRTFRAVAGESRTGTLSDGVPPMTAITSTRTTPPLEFPIRVRTTSAPESSGLKLVIPPATPQGDYTVEVAGRGPDGRSISTTLWVTVDAVTFSSAALAARPPVILLNGFQLICNDTASTLAASADTFGQLASLLQSDGAAVAFFNNCTYGEYISIEQLAGQLNNYIAGLQYTDGAPVTQVDLVVHSMGGLIARAYLAGKGQTSGVFAPPANPKVRKLVAIATPHFGSFKAGYIGTQESEMALGNQFLWDLATWNQGQDDLRGVDALAVIGNAGTHGTTNNASDGVVSLPSPSLGFVEPDQRTRIVPYCHVTPGFLTGLAMSCSNNQGIADINDPSHLTAQIVRSFLADTTAWQSIGNPPSTDPFLRIYGGALLALKGTNDVYFTDLTAVSFDNAAGSFIAGPSNAIARLYYSEFIAGGQHNFSMTHSNGQVTTGTGTPVAGSGRALLFKFGPIITAVQSATGGLPGLTVASGSNITVYGGGFSGAGTQLTANGAALSISSLSDQQMTAFLPAGYNGLVELKVTNANGQHTVNMMAAQASTIAVTPISLQFAYTVGGTIPAAQSIQITNSGGGTLNWSATTGASWLSVASASGTALSTLSVLVSPTGLGVGTYTGSVQISAAGASNSPVSVTVTLTVAPAPASLAVSPQALTFNYTVGGTVSAAQGVSITNRGGGTLNWSATTSASWLSVAPASGTAPSTLSVLVSPTGLGAGTYTGSVQISAAGASNSPQTVSVTLTVNAPPPTISLSAVQLHFSYVVGGVAPASQSVVVSNSGGGTFTWSAASSASWLTLSSAPGVLTVAINLAGLSPNTYTGTITITAAGAANRPKAVSVTLTVTAPPPSISLSTGQAHFAYATGGAPPAPQSISISNSGGGTLAWSASSNASWLSATPSGTAPSTLTISVTPTSLPPGPYQGAITVSAAGAANSPQTISVSLTVSAAVPSVVITSVTNSASGASGAIAPGEIITIKGSGLGPATGVSFSVDPNTGMVDSTLAGPVVLFGSFAAPITYASAAQINAIVPYEVAGPPQIAVQVQYQGAVSNSFTVQVAAAAPGAFTFNSTGAGQAVAANQDGSFNGPSNPAPKGSYLTIYFTGGGQTNPSGVTGSVTGAVLKWLAQPITVTVGGQQGTVAFDCTAPTFVDGVGQLNIQLPTAMPSGSALPLVITVGGFASPNTATLAVQ